MRLSPRHLLATIAAAKSRLTHGIAALCPIGRFAAVSMALALTTTAAHAAVLYTFSNTGANPYSFSFLELSPITTTGTFAIPPFQVGGLTFTQADLSISGGVECFQFATAGASISVSSGSCSAGANAPDGAWESLFFGTPDPGTYTAFNALSDGSAPAAPDQLTIQNVAATLYTFSNTGANPYSFSFLELSPLTATGAFAIAPFDVGGFTFTQADLSNSGGVECFQFGTAGASISASPGSCSAGANAPDGAWESLFFGTPTPGTYTAFNALTDGSAPSAPDQLTIVALAGPLPLPPPPSPVAAPEPPGLALIIGGLAVLAVSVPRRRRRLPNAEFPGGYTRRRK